jgi:hypothetical protein
MKREGKGGREKEVLGWVGLGLKFNPNFMLENG